jgi:hypothetical protein
MKTFKLLALALATASAVTISIQATTINGDILFNGNGTVDTSVPGITTFVPTNPWTVATAIGSYSTVPTGSLSPAVTKANVSYTGTGTGATLVAEVKPEWTFTVGTTVYSFDLLALTSGTYTPGSPSSIALSGTGIAHIDGFEDTYASWSLSGTGGNGFTFRVASTQTSAEGQRVPDGGATIALLGVGLLGLGAIRRKL